MLGVVTQGAEAEIDVLVRMLAGERYLSFAHGDFCPR